MVVTDLENLRDEIERTAARDDLTSEERRALLTALRARLTEATGLCDRYLADEDRVREGEAQIAWEQRERLYANADLRAQLLDRGLATEDELDNLGYFSHADLEKLSEAGRLEEAVEWLEKLHPRERTGKFKEKFGSWLRSNLRFKSPPKEPLVGPRRRPRTPEAPSAPSPPTEPPEVPDEFAQKRTAMEKRVADFVASGLERAKLTDAEQHFNEAGAVSQRTLLQYVNDAATQPRSIDRYSTVDANGVRTWDESRRDLHEAIIDMFLRQRVFNPDGDGGKGTWELSAEAPPLEGVENPEVLFSGGGYAAGKSSVLKINRAAGKEPESGYDGPTLVLDPDMIKAQLPEFQELLGSDPEANLIVYEEAWLIAQEIQARAQERKLNMVVDGISDTSPDEMIQRAQSFFDNGYTGKAIYVDIPTEEAMRRAENRARNAKDDSDKRHIPEVIMRAVHRDVSATVPNMLRRLAEDNIPLEVEVWDNDQGKDEQGSFRPPKRHMHYVPGTGENVEDEFLWGRFKGKAQEEIKLPGGTTA